MPLCSETRVLSVHALFRMSPSHRDHCQPLTRSLQRQNPASVGFLEYRGETTHVHGSPCVAFIISTSTLLKTTKILSDICLPQSPDTYQSSWPNSRKLSLMGDHWSTTIPDLRGWKQSLTLSCSYWPGNVDHNVKNLCSTPIHSPQGPMRGPCPDSLLAVFWWPALILGLPCPLAYKVYFQQRCVAQWKVTHVSMTSQPTDARQIQLC